MQQNEFIGMGTTMGTTAVLSFMGIHAFALFALFEIFGLLVTQGRSLNYFISVLFLYFMTAQNNSEIEEETYQLHIHVQHRLHGWASQMTSYRVHRSIKESTRTS